MNQQEGQDNMNLNNDEKDLEDNAEQIKNDNKKIYLNLF